MKTSEEVSVTRDVEAVVIPAGTRILLLRGETVTITQAMGGGYTVVTPQGFLARIEGKDADALGKEVTVAAEEEEAKAPLTDLGEIERRAWELLETIYDPEIPVNIVDMGLIYECRAEEGERGPRSEVKMTMTAPGCGMGDVLRAEAEQKLGTIPGISEVRVEIVWDPPWDQSRMSESARLELGFG